MLRKDWENTGECVSLSGTVLESRVATSKIMELKLPTYSSKVADEVKYG